MARPRGEIRLVLGAAVTRLAEQRGPVNYRVVAREAQVGFDAARTTLDNMARSGELRIAGKERPAGASHWHNLYEPIAAAEEEEPRAWGGIEALADAVKGWAPVHD